MGHVCQGDFLPGKEHLRSQDDEALSRVFTVENGYRRSPQVKEAGAVSVPWSMTAKDRCWKTSNVSSQKISKGLCNMFLKWRKSIESMGKEANQPLLSGWKEISALRTLAVVAESSIYYSKFLFSLKDGVLMNSAEPSFLPCEGRILKRQPSDSIKSGWSKSKGRRTWTEPCICLCWSGLPFAPPPILKIFKLHIKISDSCLTKYSDSITNLESMNENKILLELWLLVNNWENSATEWRKYFLPKITHTF